MYKPSAGRNGVVTFHTAARLEFRAGYMKDVSWVEGTSGQGCDIFLNVPGVEVLVRRLDTADVFGLFSVGWLPISGDVWHFIDAAVSGREALFNVAVGSTSGEPMASPVADRVVEDERKDDPMGDGMVLAQGMPAEAGPVRRSLLHVNMKPRDGLGDTGEAFIFEDAISAVIGRVLHGRPFCDVWLKNGVNMTVNALAVDVLNGMYRVVS